MPCAWTPPSWVGAVFGGCREGGCGCAEKPRGAALDAMRVDTTILGGCRVWGGKLRLGAGRRVRARRTLGWRWPGLAPVALTLTGTHAHAGLDPETARKMQFIASMGIYVFKKEVMLQLLAVSAPASCFL